MFVCVGLSSSQDVNFPTITLTLKWRQQPVSSEDNKHKANMFNHIKQKQLVYNFAYVFCHVLCAVYRQRSSKSKTKAHRSGAGLTTSFYLIIVVRVKSTPGALGPGRTDKWWHVKLHTSALRQTGVWTGIRLCTACHRRAQIRRGMGAVVALRFPVFIMRLVPMMVGLLVVMLVVAMPSMGERVLHNVLHLWVIWMAWLLERQHGWGRWTRQCRGGCRGKDADIERKIEIQRTETNLWMPMITYVGGKYLYIAFGEQGKRRGQGCTGFTEWQV